MQKSEVSGPGAVEDPDSSRTVQPRRDALRIVALYIVMGMLWILLSDRALSLFTQDLDTIERIQLYKGWIYIFLSGGVFYLIISSNFRVIKKNADLIAADNHRLAELVHSLEVTGRRLEKQKEEQGALAESFRQGKELLDSIFLHAPVFIMTVDVLGALQELNPYAEALLGYRADELRGKIARNILVSPSYQAKSEQIFLQIRKGQQKSNFEMSMRAKGGAEIILLLNAVLLHSKEGEALGIVLIGMDISDRRQMEERLRTLAYTDRLTGLPNLAWLYEEGPVALRHAEALGRKAALLYFDIDDFKHINETLGHEAGDQFLRHLAERLSSFADERTTVYRLGGDEFVVLVSGSGDIETMRNRSGKMLEALSSPWDFQGQRFHASASGGLAIYPEHGRDISQLLQNADAALSEAKRLGRNGIEIYDTAMRAAVWRRLTVGAILRNAIESRSVDVHFQPIVELSSGNIVSFEALARLEDPQGGMVPPSEFIPLAENSSQIAPLTDLVLGKAMEFLDFLAALGRKDLTVSVNVSGRLLAEGLILPLLDGVCDGREACARSLELEVTETAAVIDFPTTIDVLGKLKAKGFVVSLDDFGTGYSSLTYLRTLPIGKVKIDRNFIQDLSGHEDRRAVLQAIVELSHLMELDVVAEGVETGEQLRILRELGCDYGQGFVFSRALSREDIPLLLEKASPPALSPGEKGEA